jgi:hypothetical protein
MKHVAIITFASLALAGQAFAQSTTITTPSAGGVVTTAPRAGATVTIAPEQRTRMKQYVVQQKVKPYAMRERMAVGTTLPAEAELYAVPSEWGPGLGTYRYVYSGNSIGLVEPTSRRVIEIIE